MDSEGNRYDLEERTYRFALDLRICIATYRWKRSQWTDIEQLLRSSGSVAANYVEANNAVSKADFLHRLRISKKEATESRLWLRLLGATTSDDRAKETLRTLYRESDELVRILSTILRNSIS
ncbi:four helix bundle protein [Luteolibacter sp. LG18]|uniref:four helix bundle protein n=1 Tax=Luteolibacter sp. LG18 TaxID=2819286 RepID=UPI002B2FC5F9|nr:hypothetical protein llg_00840 [Luteolibacter sp. LG18]